LVLEKFELPEEVLDKHLTDTSDEEEVEAPTLDEEDESPELEEEDTDEESPSDESEDTDEDESGDADPDSTEDDEEKDADEEDSDEDSDEDSFLPKFDRKKIEADPELNKAYKHMQAAFTKAQQEARTVQREAEMMKADFEAFIQDISTDQGAEEFLVKVALSRPEVFRAAAERADELSDDPSELKKFERDVELKRREQEIKRREQAQRLEEQERRVTEIESMVDRTGKKLGMDAAELKIAHEYVANTIFKIRAAGGKDISAEEIIKAVNRAASDLSVNKRRVREEAERAAEVKAKQLAKEKARKAKRPAPPRSSAAPARRAANKLEVPAGTDPLAAAVNRALGVE
jgi:hypothetical protein